MIAINFDIWSGTIDQEIINKLFQDLEPRDTNNIVGVIPFKNYKFNPGELGEIVCEVQELNPNYSVLSYSDSNFDIIIFQMK